MGSGEVSFRARILRKPLLLQPENAALVGMGALAVAVVGGPLTMSFLVLETTRDFGVSAATWPRR
jgi:CIC family chloride channel protein